MLPELDVDDFSLFYTVLIPALMLGFAECIRLRPYISPPRLLKQMRGRKNEFPGLSKAAF
jgi:hypothetical protein